MLNPASERALIRLVERWDLHSPSIYCLPVPIAQVARNEGWTLRYVDGLYPLYGFAAVRPSGRLMGINAEVSRPYQRMAIGHEIGHVLNGDQARLHLCSEWEWLYGRQERAATMIAARILIPDIALREGRSISEIAALCDVPTELVELRIGRR